MRKSIKRALSSGPAKKILPSLMRKRGAPLYLSVAIHTEHIQDEAVFGEMAAFGRKLPFKAAAFVMTPYSPIVKKDMEARGLEEEAFTERLKALAALFEIGLHGHYCRPAGPGAAAGETAWWLAEAGFERTSGSPEMVKAQFKAEYDYLAAHIRRPEAYSAGWWYMNETVAALLDEYGIRSDCSIRNGHPDSFGGRYIPQARMPGKGRPFILPGSKNVAEFPSVFYLNSDWWQLARELLPMLVSSGRPLFAVLPAHDHELAADGEKMLENIGLLSSVANVEFVPFSRMRELALAAGGIPAALTGAAKL